MSQPVLLQDRFTGFWRDDHRDNLPSGKCWDIIDFLLMPGGGLAKRGGWTVAGSNITNLDASAGKIRRVIVAPFTTLTQVLAIDDRSNCELFDTTNGADRGSIYGAAAGQPQGQPVFYRNTLIFPTAETAASSAPRKYDGTTISALGGSPPDFKMPVVYKDRLAVVSVDTPQRIYFSAAGNAESWDTTNRYLDTSAPIIALAPMKNFLLVFHEGSVERIRGSIPPGSAAANMELEPLFSDAGLSFPDALYVSDDYVYWADEAGIHRSDGSGSTDLTKQGGISSYYRNQAQTIDITNICLTVFRGNLVCAMIRDVSGDDFPLDCLVYSLAERGWVRFSNITVRNFAVKHGFIDELYMSESVTGQRVAELTEAFNPDNAISFDNPSSSVSPQLDTPYYTLGILGKKRWKDIYLNYQLDGSLAKIQVQYYDILKRGEDNPTVLSDYLVTGAAGRSRRPMRLGKLLEGVAFKFRQTTASSVYTNIHAIEADVRQLEGSR